MKKLNMNEMIFEPAEVCFNNESFKITPDIPAETIFSMSDLAEVKITKYTKEIHGKIKNIIKDILYQMNDEKKVNKFVDGLGFAGTNKIMTFLTEYINEVLAVDTKKKEDTATLSGSVLPVTEQSQSMS